MRSRIRRFVRSPEEMSKGVDRIGDVDQTVIVRVARVGAQLEAPDPEEEQESRNRICDIEKSVAIGIASKELGAACVEDCDSRRACAVVSDNYF